MDGSKGQVLGNTKGIPLVLGPLQRDCSQRLTRVVKNVYIL